MDLHAQIMNIQVPKKVKAELEGAPKGFYLLGHRDARHAAAELAIAAQTDAYAEGRKDEREEWLPVLEALKSCAETLAVFVDDGSAAPDSVIGEDLKRARAAIASVEGKS